MIRLRELQSLRRRRMYRIVGLRCAFSMICLVLLVGSATLATAGTWLNPPPRNYSGVVFATPTVGWLYAGDVLHTADGGQTWMLQRTWITPGGFPLQMQFVDPLHGWVPYGHGILHRTADGGRTWQVVQASPRGPDADPPYRTDLDKLRMLNAQVGFGLNDSGDILLRTTDGGLTWRTSRFGKTGALFDELAFVDVKRGWVAGNGDVFATANGGQTWLPLPKAPGDGPYRMQFLSDTTGWLLNYPSGRLNRTSNGGQSWQACAAGQSTPKIYGFFFRTPTLGWAAAAGGIILRTADACSSWTQVQTASTVDLGDVHFPDEMNGWAAGANNTVLKTTDGGLTWTPVQVNVP
jgi:photosystem II stability/assembly factor-like uncharacterized protein